MNIKYKILLPLALLAMLAAGCGSSDYSAPAGQTPQPQTGTQTPGTTPAPSPTPSPAPGY